jgi:hypothetical protein
MTTFGRNLKLTASRDLRQKVHEFFVRGLEASTREVSPDLQLYVLGDGFNIGVYYVDPSKALTDEQGLAGPWLEFLVDDVEATFRKLLELGGREIDYQDKSHHYVQAPGGLMFRLAPR